MTDAILPALLALIAQQLKNVSLAGAVAVFVWLIGVAALTAPTLRDYWKYLRGDDYRPKGDITQFVVGCVLLVGVAILWFAYPEVAADVATRTVSGYSILAAVLLVGCIVCVSLAVRAAKSPDTETPLPRLAITVTDHPDEPISKDIPDSDGVDWKAEYQNLVESNRENSGKATLILKQLENEYGKLQRELQVAKGNVESQKTEIEQLRTDLNKATEESRQLKESYDKARLILLRQKCEEDSKAAYATALNRAKQETNDEQQAMIYASIQLLTDRMAKPVKSQEELEEWEQMLQCERGHAWAAFASVAGKNAAYAMPTNIDGVPAYFHSEPPNSFNGGHRNWLIVASYWIKKLRELEKPAKTE